MEFSKALQVKHLVNRWNKDRAEGGFGYIVFNCSMFSIGNWSVDIKPMNCELFFSNEMNQLITLYAGGGFMLNVGAYKNCPSIHML